MIFIPYVGIGEFRFGDEANKIKALLGQPSAQGTRLKDVSFLHYEYEEPREFIFRFDNNHLSQITLCSPAQILYDELDLCVDKDLQQFLVGKKMLARRAYRVLLDVGLSVDGFMGDDEVRHFHLFTKQIQLYWENVHRPITSW
jgi:hypothetical protein